MFYDCSQMHLAILILAFMTFVICLWDCWKRYKKKKITIKFAKCHELAKMPEFAHKGDSGFDIHSIEQCVLLPHTRKLIRTGLKVEIPEGYEMQIRPRSGLSIGTNLTVIKGTIDSGYRGEIGIIAHNTGSERFTVKIGERLAQGVIGIVPKVELIEVNENELSESTRGQKGFGSTGV